MKNLEEFCHQTALNRGFYSYSSMVYHMIKKSQFNLSVEYIENLLRKEYREYELEFTRKIIKP